jgi:ubiquinone/menaquinone biosynthesis C-methylase UbiE
MVRYNGTVSDVFDSAATAYDRWYDTSEGSSVFADELWCLRSVVPVLAGDWVEVGVGTGRFAAALGIAEGLDSSPSMLALAQRRGIRIRVGSAENLPYAPRSLDGVLMVASLCFIRDVPRALSECARVLRTTGTLLVGDIPSDGPWGIAYRRKGESGHPLYSQAQFTTGDELVRLAGAASFTLRRAASTLFWGPGSTPPPTPHTRPGIVAGAGFLALAFAPIAVNSSDCTPAAHAA